MWSLKFLVNRRSWVQILLCHKPAGEVWAVDLTFLSISFLLGSIAKRVIFNAWAWDSALYTIK